MFNMTPFKFMSPLEIVYYYILGMGNKRGVRKRGKCEPKDRSYTEKTQPASEKLHCVLTTSKTEISVGIYT